MSFQIYEFYCLLQEMPEQKLTNIKNLSKAQ